MDEYTIASMDAEIESKTKMIEELKQQLADN